MHEYEVTYAGRRAVCGDVAEKDSPGVAGFRGFLLALQELGALFALVVLLLRRLGTGLGCSILLCECARDDVVDVDDAVVLDSHRLARLVVVVVIRVRLL